MTKQEIRLQPQNLEAERSVLGCQMLDARTIDPVAEIISAADYWNDAHTMFQRAITALHDDGIAPDAITVADKLHAIGSLEDVGGVAYVVEILESVPHAGHAVYYAKLVAEQSQRRKAIAIGERLIKEAWNPGCSSSDVLEAAIKSSMELSDLLTAAGKNRVHTMRELVDEALETELAGTGRAVKCGLEDIDAAIGGAAFGEMIIIGGRPSHGKTLLALQWIDAASACGLPGLIVSEEMSVETLSARALSSILSMPRENWKSSEQQVRWEVKDHFSKRAQVIVADKCHTIAAVEREVAKAVQNHGIKIVAIDYAQLLKGDGNGRYEQVSDVSVRTKRMATKHGIIVLLLAQIGRDFERRPDVTPRMSDLRDSGQLEQDADVILFTMRPSMIDDKYEDKNEIRIYHSKNRNRGIGTAIVQLELQPTRQRLISRTPIAAEDWA